MSFDLNIDNYNIDELKEMFDLPKDYNTVIFNQKEAKLKEVILNNQQIDEKTRENTIDFLIKAKKFY